MVKAVAGRRRVLIFQTRVSRGAMEERAMAEAGCWRGVGA